MPPVDRWEDPSGDKFLVRGADYMKTKKKVPSADTFYRCESTQTWPRSSG